MSRQDGGAALAESDTGIARPRTEAAEDNLVSICKKGAGLAGRKGERLGTVAGKLKQAAGGGKLRAGDGTGGNQVADLEIAAVAGMVGN
jgi:hypothetical protein